MWNSLKLRWNHELKVFLLRIVFYMLPTTSAVLTHYSDQTSTLTVEPAYIGFGDIASPDFIANISRTDSILGMSFNTGYSLCLGVSTCRRTPL